MEPQSSNPVHQDTGGHASSSVEVPSQSNAVIDTAEIEPVDDSATIPETSSTFSDVDEGEESATESLSPQFLVHVEENGRRYHPEPEKVSNYEHPYWAPNDEREQDRVDLSNHLWNLILPGLFLSPIRNPQSILDLGTGTGIWAIDVADEYPSAKVLGTDLSPIQPIWIPPNLKFTVDDFNHPPPGRDTIEGTWDFIHARELMGGVRYWPKLIEDSFQALEAGGWLELAEWNFHFLGEDVPPILNRWAETMIKAGEKNGMTFDMCGGLERWMKERGFVNVIKTTYQVPFGRWPADRKQRLLGNWNYLRLRMDVKGHCLRPMVRFLGMDKDQTDVQIAFIENALEKMYMRCQEVTQECIVVYGQKPPRSRID